jgi:hypothetical protein
MFQFHRSLRMVVGPKLIFNHITFKINHGGELQLLFTLILFLNVF